MSEMGVGKEVTQGPLVALQLSYTWHLLAPSTTAQTMRKGGVERCSAGIARLVKVAQRPMKRLLTLGTCLYDEKAHQENYKYFYFWTFTFWRLSGLLLWTFSPFKTFTFGTFTFWRLLGFYF
jgi:hypothetical protein